MTARPKVVVMAKEPRPGRVKTRLARDVGVVSATWWFRHQVRRLLRRIGNDPRWQVVLAVSPDHAVAASCWPAHLPKVAQGTGDLGARMGRALAQFGPGPVLVIGADIPGVDRAAIAEAVAVLRGRDGVLGPAPDGGYWLVGLRLGARRLPAKLFEGVRWSGPHALSDTLATMGPLRVGFATTLDDVDTVDDLRRVG
ncbi:MAG: TIGR04282 family arsenosugar biosynthesis glycosyltransferase [Pseudomonadota bacterium]